ncbi:MAG: DNA polymerase III subunit gamma/tau [Paraprevotella sp.]|nr:DNA polymerase III subunit gamma/tau [Paraprevotella sp.]
MEDYIVSARKYRPSAFDAVVGQSALTTTLKNAIASGRLAHAYLFCGPRGVGKTTCARIFAKTINCLHPAEGGEACNECESCRAFNEQRSLNIHELDAASNNSVEDIRALIEQVRIPPQVGRYKVFIIDEVHMLSAAAFNAFLKTLEEPPAHVIFILATTEKHKILPTILSRCQIYDFNRMTVEDTVRHLTYVAEREGYTCEPEALNVIAQKADGGMRDALSIFDQVASFTGGNITYRQVIDNLNVLDYEYYFRLTDHFLKNEVAQCMLLFNEVLEHGFDGSHFIGGLASHLRDLLVSKDESTLSLLEVGDSVRARYREQAQRCPAKFLYRAIKLCNDCDLNYRTSKNKRLLVEITLIQTAQLTEGDDEAGAGHCPADVLSPIFQKSSGQAQPAPKDNRQQTAATTVAEPRTAYNNPLPQPQAQPVRKPTVKLGSLSPSIRHPQAQQQEPAQKTMPTPTPQTGSTNATKDEDYIVNEKDISFYWHEFANLLPQEETAMAKRMKILQPKLLQGETFEVVVDNEQVKVYMTQIAPRIEQHLRSQLHNRRITMKVRVAESNEVTRIYSKPELLQMMLRKSPALLKLKETLNLELR